MSFWIAGAMVVSTAAGLYENSKSNENANRAMSLEGDIMGKQDYYNNQLMELMGNPDKFLSSQIFQSSLNTGTQAVTRGMAAQGFKGSGNEATALQQFGQSLASTQLLGQEELLAGLSGAGNASSPTQAVTTAVGAQSTSYQQLGQLLAGLGYSSGGGGAGGSTAAANPTNMAGYSDWYASLAQHP